jgi:4-amino-4-deoxy-L-arabinose transferase-like glycosyltransferase
MPYPINATRRFPSSKIAIALLSTIFLAFNAQWIWHYRSSQILDIDEAGYLGFAISNYHAWMSGGLPAWIQQVEAPSIQAPMTTALASLLFLISGPSIYAGFAIPLLAGCLSVVGTYWLARCLNPDPSALLSAALVASCPIIINYSRSFHFAMPATAVTTLALVCMLRSRHFSSPLWASLFGICLGLLPLARTMAIAFIPGIIIGATIHLAAKRSEPWRRVGIFSASLLIAIITASTWLFFNGKIVFEYLFNFGYGTRASEYGDKQSIFNIDAWLSTIQLTLDYIHIPHALVLLAGALAAAFVAATAILNQGLIKSLNELSRSAIFPILIVLILGIAALTTSQNKGTAFIAPLIPLAFVATVWLVRSSLPSPLIRATAATLGGAICIIASVPLANASSSLAYPWEVKLPGLGWWMKVTSGRGPIQHYEKGMLDAARDTETPLEFSPSQPLPPSHERAYVNLISSTSRYLQVDSLGGNGVALGFRHYLFNANSLRLSGLFRGKEPPPLIQVEPMVTGDSIEGYYKWLTNGEAANACLLLTLSGDREQPLPIVTKPFLLQAAQKAGFIYYREWLTPSGQKLGLWKRTQGARACNKPMGRI